MALGETWPYWPPLPTDGSLPQPIGFLPFPYPLRDEQSRCFRVLITVAIGLAEVILAIYIELHRKTNIKRKTKTSISILILPGIWSRVSHFRHALWFIMKIVPKMGVKMLKHPRSPILWSVHFLLLFQLGSWYLSIVLLTPTKSHLSKLERPLLTTFPLRHDHKRKTLIFRRKKIF